MKVITSALTAPTALIARKCRRSVSSAVFQRGCGPGKRAATRASSFWTQAPSGTGRTSRRSISRSGIDGLPELGHGAVQERAGVRGADAEDLGDLGVGEVGVVLEGDQLAVPRGQPVQREPHGVTLG